MSWTCARSGKLDAGVTMSSSRDRRLRIVAFTCSVHAGVRWSEPGLCPECRSELLPVSVYVHWTVGSPTRRPDLDLEKDQPEPVVFRASEPRD